MARLLSKINWLVLFAEIISLSAMNNTKAVGTLCGKNTELLIVKAGGTRVYR
jgi:hypothetical protein